jgi:class 3 adenylate cyclase
VDGGFREWSQVFTIIDEIVTTFPRISKLWTTQNMYVFAGGIFGTANKSEKHAEEATNFGLKLIGSRTEIYEKTGLQVSFMIGLNTGGPLVAGVVSRNRPAFQLIGAPVDLAEDLVLTGIQNELHVTRSVYELVSSHNSRVVEGGDVKVRGGKTIPSSVITP